MENPIQTRSSYGQQHLRLWLPFLEIYFLVSYSRVPIKFRSSFGTLLPVDSRTPRDQCSEPRSRCRTPHDQRSEPRSRCRTPRDQRSEPFRLQAQEYYINYNYKSNSQEYIQSIIKYTNSIHIVINILELAFQSYEGVDTEDLYLSQNLGHGRYVWRVQSDPIWSCKGYRRILRVCHPCMGLFLFLSLLSTTRE